MKKTTTILDVLKRFKLENLIIGTQSASITLTYTNWDSEAAWLLYVELITRVTSQPLREYEGDERAALESIHKIFDITREILKNYGKNAKSFTPISIIVLNKLLRPFVSKWHREVINGSLKNKETKTIFRKELEELRISLVYYIKLLSDMAGIDDFTNLCL